MSVEILSTAAQGTPQLYS